LNRSEGPSGPQTRLTTSEQKVFGIGRKGKSIEKGRGKEPERMYAERVYNTPRGPWEGCKKNERGNWRKKKKSKGEGGAGEETKASSVYLVVGKQIGRK